MGAFDEEWHKKRLWILKISFFLSRKEKKKNTTDDDNPRLIKNKGKT